MSPQNEDFLFAQEAQRNDYVTEEQVEAGFGLQRRMLEDLQLDERLSVILVKRGWINQEQAQRVYARLEPEGRRSEIEGYEIIEKLGSGSMGTVYKAIHKRLQRPVAIKILRSDLTKETIHVERLKEEAKLLASLDHPNIVRAIDAGESAGFPFVVMEYVEGDSLKDLVERRGPFREVDALKIIRDVADALERARRMGVVHRDVKPGNIVLSKQGVPKLMDLGLAKGPVDLGLTQHGATVGTPQYISPEQAQDPRRADTRSDIYSLGATLYAMLTGRPPFSGQTLAEVLTKVLYEEPTPIRVLNKSVSPETAYLVERMMLKDTGLRYRTPAEVVHDCDEILAGRSIIPAGFRGNWEAFLLRRRIRRLTKAAAIGVLAVLLLGGGLFWYVRHRQHQALLGEGAQAIVVAMADSLPHRTENLPNVQKRLMTARSALEHWDEVGPEGIEALRARVQALQREARGLERLARVAKEVEKQVYEDQFSSAQETLDKFSEQFRDSLGPVTHEIRDQQAKVRTASDTRFRMEREKVAAAVPHSLADAVATWQAYEKALQTSFLRNPDVDQARKEAQRVGQALRAIEEKVTAIEEEFTDARLHERLLKLQFAALRRELDDRRRAAVTFTEREWEPWTHVGLGRVRRMREHVESRLNDVERGLDQGVQQCWEAVSQDVRRLESSGRFQPALRLLARFKEAVAQAGFPAMVRRASDAWYALDEAREAKEKQATRDVQMVLEDVRSLVAQGDAEGIRKRVDDTLQGTGAEWPFLDDISELRGLADGVDGLYETALQILGAAKRVEDVALRDGRTAPRWYIQRVDPLNRTLTVSPTARGKRQEIALSDIHPEQLLRWVGSEGKEVPPLARAAALLASAEGPTADDLRPAIRSAQKLEDAVREGGIRGELLGWVRRRTEGLEKMQAAREEEVRNHRTATNLYIPKLRYADAHWYLDRVLDPTSVLRFTSAFEKWAPDFRRDMRRVEAELANMKLARHFPGARVSVNGNLTTVEWDFESFLQLELFRTGEGRACGIIQPFVSERVVTPGGTNSAFHLLSGAEGLVLDCPFVLPCIYDPAEKISVEFDLYTLKSPFFIAFDIDGLQVAVLSADPTSKAYGERWRFPADVPMLKDERKPPTVNWYGRGRGIAFHAGRGFGDPTDVKSWKWPRAGQGRNFERWGKLEKERDPQVFAFEPRAQMRVRIVRERGRVSLYVRDKLIDSREEPEWALRGATSDSNPRIQMGTGRIQIWTWTPIAIDDLRISGRVLDRWR